MPTFSARCGYANCGNNICNGFLPFSDMDENGNCLPIDWDILIVKYNNHRARCTAENPYLDDPNCYYGDAETCYNPPCQYGSDSVVTDLSS